LGHLLDLVRLALESTTSRMGSWRHALPIEGVGGSVVDARRDRPYRAASDMTVRPWHWRSLVAVCGKALSGEIQRRSMDVALLIAYVVADVGKLLMVGWANHGRSREESFNPSSLLLVQLSVSALIALGVSFASAGVSGIRIAMNFGRVLHCIPMAFLFYVSKVCTMTALGYVDAGTVKLSTELILPSTACLSVWMIPGCSYNRQQWISILTICMATLAFSAVQLEADVEDVAGRVDLTCAARHRAKIIGMSLCGAVVMANSIGSVVGERYLKRATDVPLACLKAQLNFAELLLVMFILMTPWSSGPHTKHPGALDMERRGTFAGWDARVLICALSWVPATWMSTIVTAKFSTVVKNVAQCVSTLVTYFVVLLDPTNSKRHSPSSTFLAFVIVLSVGTFSLQSKRMEPHPADGRSGGGAQRRLRRSSSKTSFALVSELVDTALPRLMRTTQRHSRQGAAAGYWMARGLHVDMDLDVWTRLYTC